MRTPKQVSLLNLVAIILVATAIIVALMYMFTQVLEQRRVKDLIENKAPGSELPQSNVGGETEFRQFEQQ